MRASRWSCRAERPFTSSRLNRVGPRAGEAAAGDKDVSVSGGAQARRSGLAGLLDALVSIVPVILGGGARLFDNLGDPKPKLEQVEAIEAPGVTHIRYARV